MGRIHIYFDDDVEEWIRDKAAERGVSVSAFIKGRCDLLSDTGLAVRIESAVREAVAAEFEARGFQPVSVPEKRPLTAHLSPHATSHSEQAGCSTRDRRRPALKGVVRC